MRVRNACVALIAALAAWAGPWTQADAAERLRGTVLTVIVDKHEAIVAHDSYGGMPAMTMGFSLSAADAARLHAGERIDAAINASTQPATLRDVHVSPAAGAATRSVTLLNAGELVPQTRFVDQNGQPFTFAAFRGKTVVLSFIYTRCGDTRMCPLISANFRQLQRKLGTQPYQLVEITLDPEFDTPPVLLQYGKQFDFDPAHWTLGTGEPRAVLDFAARFGIAPFHDPRVGIIHTERTVLVDKDGRIADLIDEAGWNPDNVVARIRSLNNAPSNPLALLDYNLSRAAIAVCGNEVAGYSGLLDLAVVLIIFSAAAWTLIRVGRYIFTAKA